MLMSKPKVMVIGASGLIGSNIYYELKDNGYEAIGTYYTNKDFLREGMLYLNITIPSDLERYIRAIKPSIIVNSAGISGKEACNKSPELATKVNLTATKSLAEICDQHDIKLVHLSSVAVHDGSKKSPYTEADNPSIIEGNIYNETKAKAEPFAEKVAHSIIARIGDTYGFQAYEPSRMGGSIFRWAYENLKQGKELPAFTGLRSNQTYIPDIAMTIKKLIEEDYEGRINVGGEPIEVCHFFEKMKQAFNLPGSIIPKAPPADYQANKELDISKLLQLGIRLKTIDEGLNSLISYYKI